MNRKRSSSAPHHVASLVTRPCEESPRNARYLNPCARNNAGHIAWSFRGKLDVNRLRRLGRSVSANPLIEPVVPIRHHRRIPLKGETSGPYAESYK